MIHERFTLQPCPHRAKTTVAIEGCLEHKVLRTDRRVHGFELGALQLLKSGHRQDFIRGERAWYAYREGICSAEASRWAGGTVHSVVFASCVLAENRAHLKPLGLLNGTVEPGDGP